MFVSTNPKSCKSLAHERTRVENLKTLNETTDMEEGKDIGATQNEFPVADSATVPKNPTLTVGAIRGDSQDDVQKQQQEESQPEKTQEQLRAPDLSETISGNQRVSSNVLLEGKAEESNKWARLRRAVFSASRAKLFVDVPELELGLFEKICEVTATGTRLTFSGWHSNMKNQSGNLKLPTFDAIQVVRPKFEHADQVGTRVEESDVDTTGLLKLYPSEEVLGAYLLFHAEEFAHKNILELGAGFCGLAGLLLARCLPTGAAICLSDGSQACLKLACEHLQVNHLQNLPISTRQIFWDRKADYADEEKYDIILISDCLYLNKLHPDLLNAIFYLLKDESSRCIVVSPPRYKSLDLFIARAESRFHVRKSTEEIAFLDAIRTDHNRAFQPYFVEMHKKKESSMDIAK